jgi:uncharacterized protein (DUF2062 family)
MLIFLVWPYIGNLQCRKTSSSHSLAIGLALGLGLSLNPARLDAL